MRYVRKNSRQSIRWQSFERLEPRRVLAAITGQIREDVTGSLQLSEDMSGLAGVVLYLDHNNNGQRDPTEPTTTSVDDDPLTAADESGTFTFPNLPMGRYVVRQELERPTEFNPDSVQPVYIQTGPLDGEIQLPPTATSKTVAFDRAATVAYSLQFEGELSQVDEEAMEQEILAALPGDNNRLARDQWLKVANGHLFSNTIHYRLNPHVMVQLDVASQSFPFHAIDEYELSLYGPNQNFGVGEAADVAPEITLIRSFPFEGFTRFEVPLQTVPGWRMEVDVQTFTDLGSVSPPRVSEIIEPLEFRIVSTLSGQPEVRLSGTIESWTANAERFERFGPIVELIDPNSIQTVNFWNTRDDDGDGLPNFWESPEGGIDINHDGLIDLNLASRGADPLHKDLFIEVDAMDGHAPLQEQLELALGDLRATGTTLDRVIEAFYTAEVENPNGLAGIRLHIDFDQTDLPAAPFSDPETPWDEFDVIKRANFGGDDARMDDANSGNRVAARGLVYRYGVFADSQANGSSGLAELPGDDFIVSLGEWKLLQTDGTTRNTPEQQAGTFMHELGHTLGLHHGGADARNYKPNYLSVMNYHWQVPNANGGWKLDYSSEMLPPLDWHDLDETEGIGAEPFEATRTVLVGPNPLRPVPVSGPVDWNRDGDQLDSNVQAAIYHGFQSSNQGQSRSYQLPIQALPDFETVLHGHDDWRFTPEQFAFYDDVQFAEGVHLCDNPLQQTSACHDDLTDFFTTSVSSDSFELDSLLEPVIVPLDEIDPFGIWEIDFETGTAEGFFSIHQENDQDYFELTPRATGVFQARLDFVPEGPAPLELLLLDPDRNLVGHASSIPGQTIIEFDVQTDEPLILVVKRESVAFDPAPPSDLTISPADATWYRLEIYMPHTVTVEGAHWLGMAADSGDAGDGIHWSDATNWETNGTTDAPPESELPHLFRAPHESTIELETNRTVASLHFLEDVTLCRANAPETVHVTTGIIEVAADVTATINATLESTSRLRKRGQGELHVSQTVPDLAVYDGTLTGSLDVDGDLQVGPRGQLKIDSAATVTGTFELAGTLQLDVNAGTLVAESMRFTPSSLLILSASMPVAAPGTELNRTLLQGQVDQPYFGDRESIAQVRTAQLPSPGDDGHLGHGAFLRESLQDMEQFEVTLYQARPGDANGDGVFDSSDLILVFAAGYYETINAAGWREGDWNHDDQFTSADIITAMQTGAYRQ